MLFIYLLFILLLSLWGIRISTDEDYLSKERCNSIKGIFILLIFLTHSLQYIKDSGYIFPGIDIITYQFVQYIGQLVVVMFLFYSGYGVALQIQGKGTEYVNLMPKHRILTTLLNFDIAVCIYILLDLLLLKDLSIMQVLLSFIAWDSVGNSNWYIFIIILCYVLTYIANKITQRYSWLCVFLFCLLSMLLLTYFKAPYWYDTILAYPFGYFYGCKRHQIENKLRKNYCPIILTLIIIFIFVHDYNHSYKGLVPNFIAITFALILVMITMKIKSNNLILQWFGKNLFPLYIYQRIPMITLLHIFGKEFVSHYAIFYLLSCLLITCLIARYYKYLNISSINLKFCRN